jgi:hypothetical protein
LPPNGPGNPAPSQRGEGTMYIGLGTIVAIILIILLIVWIF